MCRDTRRLKPTNFWSDITGHKFLREYQYAAARSELAMDSDIRWQGEGQDAKMDRMQHM
jgi:hypothetical protein